jgi:4-amino-4-deoxy-L-arabinose transferase-like glycosyltransferase
MLLERPRLIAILLLMLALVLRAGEVQRAPYKPVGDARAYLMLGGQVASTGGYASTDGGAGGSQGPSAYYAPGYPYLLGALDRITGNAPMSAGQVHVARLAGAVLGTVLVGFIGLIALELFGIDMALLAMALAAIYPVLIEMSSTLAAENLMVVFVMAAVWTALRAQRSGDPLRWIIATGVLTGLATLTHVNAFLLLIPLGVAVWRSVPVFGRRELGAVAVLIVSTLLTLTPWLVRDGLAMKTFVPVTDESGITLAGTYNSTSAHSDPTYRWLFYTDVHGYSAIAHRAHRMSETQLDSKLESQAFHYIAHHPGAPASVAWHNTLRMFDLAGSHAWRASAASIGLEEGVARIGVYCFWALCAMALLGLIVPRALRAPAWLWGVPWLMWLTTVLVNAETPRFREVIEPFLILLAARGIWRLASWIRSRAPGRAQAMPAG